MDLLDHLVLSRPPLRVVIGSVIPPLVVACEDSPLEKSGEKCIVVFALIVTEPVSGREGGGVYHPPPPHT